MARHGTRAWLLHAMLEGTHLEHNRLARVPMRASGWLGWNGMNDKATVDRLVGEHAGLVAWALRRLQRRGLYGVDVADLESAGWHGLWRAAQNHDARRAPFGAFARLCIGREMVDAVRRCRRRNGKVAALLDSIRRYAGQRRQRSLWIGAMAAGQDA